MKEAKSVSGWRAVLFCSCYCSTRTWLLVGYALYSARTYIYINHLKREDDAPSLSLSTFIVLLFIKTSLTATPPSSLSLSLPDVDPCKRQFSASLLPPFGRYIPFNIRTSSLLLLFLFFRSSSYSTPRSLLTSVDHFIQTALLCLLLLLFHLMQ